MNRTKLSEKEIREKLSQIPKGWEIVEGKLCRKWKFSDFIEAFSFLSKVAIHSQVLDHHPRIVNVYNQVELEIWTHDTGGLTEFDFELAKRIG